jgi:hypothetical protein
MNPLSLLNKGHTFRGFKNHSGAYRLTTKGVVPNFSAIKNTSPTTPHPEPEVSQSTFFDQPKPPVTAPAPQPPALAPQPVQRQPVWNRVVVVCREFLLRWTASGKTSPFQARTVQTELALEKVTVIRNDLSEDDLEVIPAGKKVKLAQHDQCQAISTNR